jgi:sarcosine oxidase delta subunit
MKSRVAAPRSHPPVVNDVLRAPGRALEPPVRGEMEARFGHDFSSVRVHTDGRAADSAQAVNARAYTVGSDVVFGAGRYAPTTPEGSRLLAHELAHTVQQRGATAEAAPIAPGSSLEAAADAASRAASGGRAVTQPLGRSGLAIARQMIGNEKDWVPQALQDEAKKAEFAELWARLTDKSRPDYPERRSDLVRLVVLKAEASALIKERQAAVQEAEAVAASMGMDEDVDEEEAAVLKIAEKATDPMFAPGGFTDEMIYGEYEAAKERIEKESGPAKDPRRFKDRFKEARKKAPLALLKEDYYTSIWEYGLREGLFAEHERNIVFDELRAPARERAAQERKQAEVRQYNEQIQRFRSFRSQLNLGFIQGALLGRPGVPVLLRGAYTTYGFAHTGVELYRGYQAGDPTRVVGAALPLAAGIAFHRIAGVGEPPVPSRPSGGQRQLGRGRPEEIFDYDVRTAYNADPTTVKKIASNSWAQYVWEMHGGEGIHPMAWRHPGGRVVFVNEARWTGKISEINQPHELIAPGQATQAAPRPQVDPRAPTGVAPAQEPPVPSLDPRAPTGLAPPRRSGPVTGGTGPRGQAIEVTAGETVAAFQANPRSVYGSPTSDWHMQVWILSGGRGATPVIFRSGNMILVDLELAPQGLLAQLGRGMRLPSKPVLMTGAKPGTVTVEAATQQGLVRPGGRLEPVLRSIQDEFEAGPPTNLNEALAVVSRATARINLARGIRRPQTTADEIVLDNAGGVVTRVRASGEIIVTNRDGQVVLHLIP